MYNTSYQKNKQQNLHDLPQQTEKHLTKHITYSWQKTLNKLGTFLTW